MGVKFSNNVYTCGSSYGINLYFNYCKNTLNEVLREKRKHLATIETTPTSPHIPHKYSKSKLPKNIKLNNYEQIDKLHHHDRKIVNIFYQEV